MTNAERIQANNDKLQDCLSRAENLPDAEASGVEYNIVYGDTEPTDTSKLWVKTNTPETLEVKVNTETNAIETLSTTLPYETNDIASAVVGNKVYLFGGNGMIPNGSGASSARLDTINVFDAETNSIETLSTTLPYETNGIASAVMGTKVYLFGGDDSSGCLDTINVFDTETNTIETLSASLPVGATDIATAVVGTKVYLFGGSKGVGGVSRDYLDTINVFDTETNVIETLSTTLPNTIRNMTSAVVGNKVYLFGGSDSSSDGYADTINVFDTETNVIETLSTTLPYGTSGIASAVVGNKVYLFGGTYYFGGHTYLDTINVFDTETNTIETLSITLPNKRCGMASAVVEDKVYLFGGYGVVGDYTYRIDTIYKFNKVIVLAENNVLIEVTTSKNLFRLTPNMEIGVNRVFHGNADGYGERVAAALYKDGAWTEIT